MVNNNGKMVAQQNVNGKLMVKLNARNGKSLFKTTKRASV